MRLVRHNGIPRRTTSAVSSGQMFRESCLTASGLVVERDALCAVTDSLCGGTQFRVAADGIVVWKSLRKACLKVGRLKAREQSCEIQAQARETAPCRLSEGKFQLLFTVLSICVLCLVNSPWNTGPGSQPLESHQSGEGSLCASIRRPRSVGRASCIHRSLCNVYLWQIEYGGLQGPETLCFRGAVRCCSRGPGARPGPARRDGPQRSRPRTIQQRGLSSRLRSWG